jgi:hypothetical protein
MEGTFGGMKMAGQQGCTVFLFYMNSVAILDYKTEAEVIAEATSRIEIGKPGAGYILSTACSVAPGWNHGRSNWSHPWRKKSDDIRVQRNVSITTI